MTTLPLAQAIDRFVQNDERLDVFTNGDETATMTTSEGLVVPSLANMLKSVEDATDAAIAAAGTLEAGFAASAAAVNAASAASLARDEAEAATGLAVINATLIDGSQVDFTVVSAQGLVGGSDAVVALMGVDSDGNTAQAILSDGTSVIAKPRMGSAEVRGDLAVTGDIISEVLSMGGAELSGAEGTYQWAVMDESGEVMIGIKDNTLLLPASFSTTSTVTLAADDATNRVKSEVVARQPMQQIAQPVFDFNTVILYGQSLAMAQESWPALSTTQTFGNLMLGGDVRPSSLTAAAWSSVSPGTLQPLVGVVRSTSGTVLDSASVAALTAGDAARGESPIVGMVNFASWMIQRKTMSTPKPFIALCPAVSGKTIEQLSKVNTQDAVNLYLRFTQGLSAVHSAATTGSNLGKTHSVSAIAWMQGEWDYSNANGSTKATKALYKAALAQLRTDMIADVKAATGQADDPVFILYQTGGRYAEDVDMTGAPGLHVAMAQLEFALENPSKVILAGPSYPMPDKGGHLDPNGSRWFGAMLGKAFYRGAIEGFRFRPLSPTRIERVSPTVTRVHFHVPTPPLVWDLPLVVNTQTDYPTKGFRVSDSAGDAAISSVSILGGTIVEITTARAVDQSTGRVWYASAQTDGNGCLRDSDITLSRDLYTYAAGTGQYTSANIPALVAKPYSLANWACAFHLPIGYLE